MMTYRIRIAQPPVILLRTPAQKTVPPDVLLELSNRVEGVHRRMLDLTSKDEFVSKLDFPSVIFTAFATYIVLPTAKIYIDAIILLKSWCAMSKFPCLSTVLIKAILLVTAFHYIKTCFILSITSIAVLNLATRLHWRIIDTLSKWSHSIMKLLATMENHLETKCNELHLYLLDQMDWFLSAGIEGVQTVEIGPAKHNTTLANKTSPDVPDGCRETVPSIQGVHATQSFNCRLPISKRNCGLDQEGWLFVSHPIVDFEERKDSRFS